MNAPRVAVFIPSLRGGGAERAMLLFAEGLLAKGYRVDLLVAQHEGPLVNEVPQGVRLIDLGERKVSRTLPKLTKYLVRERPQALYSTIVNANIVAILAAEGAKRFHKLTCRVVVRESNVLAPKGPLTLARRLSGIVAPRLYRRADAVISVSHDVATELCASSLALQGRVHTLPTPVVSAKIFELSAQPASHPWVVERASARDSLAARPLIVGAGRLHPQKDFPTLINAFAKIHQRSNARLIILGEGEERKRLEQQIQSLGLTECVSLPGFAPNPYPFFRYADTFVLSSRYEGMPNVLLQAMAFGTPVVATQCQSGAQEVLTCESFGRLVPPGDVDAMAQAIEECTSLPRSESAVRFVADRYSVQHATEEYLRAGGVV